MFRNDALGFKEFYRSGLHKCIWDCTRCIDAKYFGIFCFEYLIKHCLDLSIKNCQEFLQNVIFGEYTGFPWRQLVNWTDLNTTGNDDEYSGGRIPRLRTVRHEVIFLWQSCVFENSPLQHDSQHYWLPAGIPPEREGVVPLMTNFSIISNQKNKNSTKYLKLGCKMCWLKVMFIFWWLKPAHSWASIVDWLYWNCNM